MFFAAGVGAYNAAMFHLFTHAFFKALLFLCAGSVIHALHHQQDMREMGGIWKKVPWTYGAMIIGTLAITGIGIPGSYTWGFAGFFSKDAIIEAAFDARGVSSAAIFAFWIGIIAALMTSFYSWRLIFMTFHGEHRGKKKYFDEAHESPWNMRVPLVLLSIGAVFAGAVFYKYFMKDYGHFWHGALPAGGGDHHASAVNSLYAAAETASSDAHHGDDHGPGGLFGFLFKKVHGYPYWVLLLPLLASLSGLVLAWFMYVRGSVADKIKTIEETGGTPLYNFLHNKWYIDELYDATVVRATRKLGDLFWKIGDVRIIDGFGPDGVARFATGAAKRVSKLQTGYLYHYAFVMLLGVAVLILVAFRGTAG